MKKVLAVLLVIVMTMGVVPFCRINTSIKAEALVANEAEQEPEASAFKQFIGNLYDKSRELGSMAVAGIGFLSMLMMQAVQSMGFSGDGFIIPTLIISYLVLIPTNILGEIYSILK